MTTRLDRLLPHAAPLFHTPTKKPPIRGMSIGNIFPILTTRKLNVSSRAAAVPCAIPRIYLHVSDGTERLGPKYSTVHGESCPFVSQPVSRRKRPSLVPGPSPPERPTGNHWTRPGVEVYPFSRASPVQFSFSSIAPIHQGKKAPG